MVSLFNSLLNHLILKTTGVTMPGLTVADGTPRDCATARCGAQSDTAIIRQAELGTSKASALGRTTGSGPIDPATMMAVFMDGAGGMSSLPT